MRAHSVAQLRPTLCDPVACGPPGSSVPGISQVRILQWVAIPFLGGSSQGSNACFPVSCVGRWVLLHYATRGAMDLLGHVVILVSPFQESPGCSVEAALLEPAHPGGSNFFTSTPMECYFPFFSFLK